jgi:hypothetical protein
MDFGAESPFASRRWPAAGAALPVVLVSAVGPGHGR